MLKPVDGVEVFCDGCGSNFAEGAEFAYFLREQVAEWLNGADWKIEDGKHYCCGSGSKQKGLDCHPPSDLEDEDDE